jgi:hypothetical protein
MAEIRYISDILANIIPCQPAVDYERYIDSEMSLIDTTYENSKISEDHWNSKGIKCRRVTRDVKALNSEGFLLVVHEAATDTDGVKWEKGMLLPSIMSFPPVLEKLTQTEIDFFIAELKEN